MISGEMCPLICKTAGDRPSRAVSGASSRAAPSRARRKRAPPPRIRIRGADFLSELDSIVLHAALSSTGRCDRDGRADVSLALLYIHTLVTLRHAHPGVGRRLEESRRLMRFRQFVRMCGISDLNHCGWGDGAAKVEAYGGYRRSDHYINSVVPNGRACGFNC